MGTLLHSPGVFELSSPPSAPREPGPRQPGISLSKRGMQNWIRGYLAACNAGDAARIAGYFEDDAVRYYPPGTYEGPLRGAAEIGRCAAATAQKHCCTFVADQMLCEPESRRVVIEWAMVEQSPPAVLRGTEWFTFSQCGLIQESRIYFACSPKGARPNAQLKGFDYAGRGYASALKS